MKTVSSLYLLLFFLIGMYACTPESSEYPKKYVYNSYSIKSAEMYSKESDTAFEIVNGRDEFIAGMVDTVKLFLDSFVFVDFDLASSYTILDEEFIRIKAIFEPGQELDTILPYYIRNSLIYLGPADSSNFVVGYLESDELIAKDYITTIIKPSWNNPIGYYSFDFDDLEDLTVNEYILKLNEEGRIAIGDSVIAIVHPYNYFLE